MQQHRQIARAAIRQHATTGADGTDATTRPDGAAIRQRATTGVDGTDATTRPVSTLASIPRLSIFRPISRKIKQHGTKNKVRKIKKLRILVETDNNKE
jgi:hypothetical protein